MNWKRIAAGAAMIAGAIGLVVATQSTGAYYGHDPRLGSANLSLVWANAPRIYPPTAIFAWAWAAPQPWPLAFVVGFMGAVASSVLTLAGTGFLMLQRWREDEPAAETFGADAWGTIKDAVSAGLVMGQGKAVKESPCIVTIGRMRDEILTITGNQHDELGGHMLGFGSSGSGKTRTIVIPTLLSWGSSALVYTAGKLDVWEMTSGYRSTFSDVRLLDLGNPDCSRFNPMAEVRLGTDHEIDDCRLIAGQFVPAPSQKSGKHEWWHDDGKKLLSAIILHVLYTYPAKERNLGTVRKILCLPAAGIVAEVLESPRDYVIEVVGSMLTGEEKKGVDTVHKTALGYLDAWASPIIQKVTSESDFRISDLMCNERPMSLYLRLPDDQREEWRPVLKVLIQQITRSLLHSEPRMADGRAKKHKLALILDEFHSFGFAGWPEDLSVMRSYGGQAVMVTPSIATLEDVYGRSQTISGNCRVRLHLDATDTNTQQEISRQIGVATDIRESRSTSWQRGSWFASNESKSESEQTRALVDGGALRLMPRNEMQVLVAGCKPLKVSKLVDFHKIEQFKERLMPAAVAKVDRTPAPQKKTSHWRA